MIPPLCNLLSIQKLALLDLFKCFPLIRIFLQEHLQKFWKWLRYGPAILEVERSGHDMFANIDWSDLLKFEGEFVEDGAVEGNS